MDFNAPPPGPLATPGHPAPTENGRAADIAFPPFQHIDNYSDGSGSSIGSEELYEEINSGRARNMRTCTMNPLLNPFLNVNPALLHPTAHHANHQGGANMGSNASSDPSYYRHPSIVEEIDGDDLDAALEPLLLMVDKFRLQNDAQLAAVQNHLAGLDSRFTIMDDKIMALSGQLKNIEKMLTRVLTPNGDVSPPATKGPATCSSAAASGSVSQPTSPRQGLRGAARGPWRAQASLGTRAASIATPQQGPGRTPTILHKIWARQHLAQKAQEAKQQKLGHGDMHEAGMQPTMRQSSAGQVPLSQAGMETEAQDNTQASVASPYNNAAPSAYTPADYPTITIGNRTVTKVPATRNFQIPGSKTAIPAKDAAASDAYMMKPPPDSRDQNFQYSVIARNLTIATANRTAYNIDKNCRLYPLLDICTGEPIPNFPTDTTEMVAVNDDKCSRILEAIGQSMSGTATERRQRALMYTIVGLGLSQFREALGDGQGVNGEVNG
ncbi:hypothetical protein CFIMG_007969RA00001 [Ceratocystis fimbriata CBS 114723]|uniref:Uncharacterized protein n=1 Tax=Ceratocystis fimbriata CBS 114723 TaxID=1035309 RepID=A0A2C5XAZ3_9PEZI|nr:hypothetical protein CFIMG_007969RA00001 [Ceratocystis fimbriata CBS 114723]